MKLWDDIRNYFYKKKLAKQLQQSKAERAVTNLADARSMGIIYDGTLAENDNAISNFADRLRKQGKAVDILAYVNDTKTQSKQGAEMFNKKGISWMRAPANEKAEQFIQKKFDLLLCCFMHESFPLEYIAAVSQARWRVGNYSKDKTDFFDLMINTNGRRDLPYFLEQATIFLNKLKYDSK